MLLSSFARLTDQPKLCGHARCVNLSLSNCAPHPNCFALYTQAKHANEAKCTWGIDGTTGVMTDMKDLGIWEPFTVKTQTYKTAVEVMMHTTEKLTRK